MGAKRKLIAAGAVAAGTAAALSQGPPYVGDIARGFLHAAGIRRLDLQGFGRVVASLLGRTDYPPCFAQMHEHVQYITGVPPREFYLTDGRGMVDATRDVNEWYGFDVPLPFTDIYNFEAEALGAKLIYGGIDMPTIDFTAPLISEPADIDRIDIEFTPERGRIRYVIDSVNRMKEVCRIPKIVVFCAPFSLAVGLRSYPLLIRDIRRDPKFARELFTWITDEVQPRYLGLIKRETGARLGVGADAWACFPNLTVEMVENWAIPYNLRLQKRMFKEGMALAMVGTGDYCEEHPERFNRHTMEDCWRAFTHGFIGPFYRHGMPVMGMGRTQDWPMEWMQEFALRGSRGLYGKRPIIASVNARFIREGPAQAIVDFLKKVVDVLGREGKLVVWFAQIPAATPPEHVHAAVAALRTYGRYPIADDLDAVEFRMPRFEPFDRWVKKNGLLA